MDVLDAMILHGFILRGDVKSETDTAGVVQLAIKLAKEFKKARDEDAKANAKPGGIAIGPIPERHGEPKPPKSELRF